MTQKCIIPLALQSRSYSLKVTSDNGFICMFPVFPGGATVKNLPANAGNIRDVGSIPGSRRSPEEGNDSPLQYSHLENSTDRGAWWVTVYGVTESWT